MKVLQVFQNGHLLKKIKAIANFKEQIKIPPHEANLLLHCGVGSIKSLSRVTPYEMKERISRLERNLRVKTEINITFSILENWIKKANEICKTI